MNERVTILHGDARATLRTLPDGCVQTCVTSPPYFGLRAYGTPPQVWGGDPLCCHEWNTERTPRPNQGGGKSKKQDSNAGSRAVDYHDRATYADTCQHCSAWRGELGQESHPDLFCAHLLEVFREVRRVLAPSGTCWVNLGDSYGRDPAKGGSGTPNGRNGRGEDYAGSSLAGLPPKSLLMVPARFALAMQQDGWILRQQVIWHAPNAMPESVQDRPTLDYEVIYLFAKQDRYFYDAEAVREPYSLATLPQATQEYSGLGLKDYEGNGVQNPSDVKRRTVESIRKNLEEGKGRQLRAVWSINTQGFDPRKFGIKDANHFAAMPEELVSRCVQLGTSEAGQCPRCAAPWKRRMERTSTPVPSAKGSRFDTGRSAVNGAGRAQTGERYLKECRGWEPSCKCGRQPVPALQEAADQGIIPPEWALRNDPVPQVVLDPFFGTGTVGAVAARLGRRAIGCELNDAYIRIADARTGREARQALLWEGVL